MLHHCFTQPTKWTKKTNGLTAWSTATTYFFLICQVALLGLLGCKSFKTRRASFGWPRKWPINNEKWAVHF